LVGDGLQLGAQCVLALAQRRHSFTQLLDRDEFFLIGAEKPFDALANTSQFSLQALFALFCGIGRTRRREAAVEFVLDQRRGIPQGSPLTPRTQKQTLSA
jgi:hypothetical protein